MAVNKVLIRDLILEISSYLWVNDYMSLALVNRECFRTLLMSKNSERDLLSLMVQGCVHTGHQRHCDSVLRKTRFLYRAINRIPFNFMPFKSFELLIRTNFLFWKPKIYLIEKHDMWTFVKLTEDMYIDSQLPLEADLVLNSVYDYPSVFMFQEASYYKFICGHQLKRELVVIVVRDREQNKEYAKRVYKSSSRMLRDTDIYSHFRRPIDFQKVQEEVLKRIMKKSMKLSYWPEICDSGVHEQRSVPVILSDKFFQDRRLLFSCPHADLLPEFDISCSQEGRGLVDIGLPYEWAEYMNSYYGRDKTTSYRTNFSQTFHG
jgi:hypothetical protein